MRAILHPLLWTGAVCLGFVASRASGEDTAGGPSSPSVSGTCPEAASVQAVLKTLLPPARLADADSAATVSDLGNAYVVTVGERAKRYSDPLHDCGERARVAAAFIALALDAQRAPASSASATPPAPIAPPSTASIPPAPSPLRLRVDARGNLQVAPQSGLVAPGIAFRFAARSGAFGVSATCGWLAPISMTLPGESGTAQIERFPCSVGPMLRAAVADDRLELGFEGGAALGALLVSGQGFTTSNPESARFEAGVRLAFDAALHFDTRATGLSPVLGLEVTYFPAAYDLDVNPHGTVTTAPSLWAGITAGVCWSAL